MCPVLQDCIKGKDQPTESREWGEWLEEAVCQLQSVRGKLNFKRLIDHRVGFYGPDHKHGIVQENFISLRGEGSCGLLTMTSESLATSKCLVLPPYETHYQFGERPFEIAFFFLQFGTPAKTDEPPRWFHARVKYLIYQGVEVKEELCHVEIKALGTAQAAIDCIETYMEANPLTHVNQQYFFDGLVSVVQNDIDRKTANLKSVTKVFTQLQRDRDIIVIRQKMCDLDA